MFKQVIANKTQLCFKIIITKYNLFRQKDNF